MVAGRPKDNIWQFFTEITKDGTKIAECKKCQAILSYRASRLKTHHEKCESAVKGIKREHSPLSESESRPKKARDANFSSNK